MLKTVISFSLFVFAALPLFAQSAPDPADLERRIKVLEARVESMRVVSPSPEIEELRRQIEILTREIEALKVNQSEEPQTLGSVHGLGQAASKVYRSRGGVSFGGYGEMLYENFAQERENGVPSEKRDQLDLLRAVLYTGYKFNDRVLFNSELEVEHATTSDGIGEVSMELAYLDFLIDPRFNVRAGLMLMPVGLINELHEPTAFLSARRPELERVIIPSTWREPGAGIFGEWGPVSYRSYLVTGLKSEAFSSSGIRSGRQRGAKAFAEDFAAVARVDWQLLEGASLGGSIYSGASSQADETPSGRSFQGTVTLGELHGDVAFRGLSLRALWSHGSIGDAREINLANGLTGARSIGEAFGGWYAEAGYDLFSRSAFGEQSLIPFGRYERFGTQRRVPSGFLRDPSKEMSIITVGAAWKPISQTVIKLDWQRIENEAKTGVDQINAAVGYIF